MDASKIIRALGGATKLASLIGVGRSAVSMWPRNGIPARYWLTVARAAAADPKTSEITLEVIEAAHSRRNAA